MPSKALVDCSSALGTNWVIIPMAAGACRAMAIPLTSMPSVSSGTVALPDKNNQAMVHWAAMAVSSARTITLCRDVRSAITPPSKSTTMAAAVGAAMTKAASAAEPVNSSTPKAMAMGAMAVPV
jgi:hypothetical protein